MSLPIDYRWEFTRRHPYYLQFWQRAAKYREAPSQDVLERTVEHAAALLLASIGISQATTPIDPRLGVESLGVNDLGAAWAGGAVAPATFRSLAGMLLAGLPQAERMQLGRLLNESAEYDSRDSAQMAGIFNRFAQFQGSIWDGIPAAPVLSINLEMPQRAIDEAIRDLVRQWKQERGIPEHRRRDDALGDYLAVWDLREGWADGEYVGCREKTFQAIACERGVNIATVSSQYRSAFRCLSGHDYTPELWIRLMGPSKILNSVDPSAAGLLLRRPWRSPNLRPVSETVLLAGRTEPESAAFLNVAGVTQSEIASIDLALDIQSLLTSGRTDEEILRQLELGEAYRDLVAELRRRYESR